MAVLRIVPNLPARDPAALADWYRGVLGMDLIMDHGFIVTLGAGEQRTQLSMAREGGAGTDLPCLSVGVDDLDPVVARAGDAVCSGPVTEDRGVRRVFLRDPEGNLVNILQHL